MPHEVQVEENFTLGDLFEVFQAVHLAAKVDEDFLGDGLGEIDEVVV